MFNSRASTDAGRDPTAEPTLGFGDLKRVTPIHLVIGEGQVEDMHIHYNGQETTLQIIQKHGPASRMQT